ncbi:RNase adapter RapZ [Streptomyces sp. NBRC 109706]|uniref:RapZ C-terminal domain-containing protein n=1 Tax=Streptomyces sp. NBRC 109706 TaxID=1550035 RepID=UPI000B322872|nr:RNase adapter RapZ [Streptomyces sp. NBRC 109706]
MALTQVLIETIGTLHSSKRPSGDHLYFDLSDKLRNPHHDPKMRELTGLDRRVRDHVLSTPGAMQIVERIAEQARAVLAGYSDRRRRLVRVTVACRGGRHRSVAVAEEVARYLRTEGIGVEVDHRDIKKPVVQR